ncbi:isochorismatase-like [Akkermansia glycaniphila]|uniref:Isochorismatase-like n=2 Tax=Akkermansia glycaniphila TaxID=1679444 RepID=A0A1H6LGB4_9BACT|nr:cysteine hydrolase family protein [Akkermansia glycaniphila]SEH85103.1 isochorismatase-like [Akkermansia glycaniphila]
MMNPGLLLIDIQNDYFTGGKWELHRAEQAAAQASGILDRFRSRNLPVFHIQHINLKEGAPFFVPNTPGAEIHRQVAPVPGETLIVKHAPDSFFQTDLHLQLERRHIGHLVVCGMMTHMCVDTTVRAAKNYGYGITLIEDACATKDLLWHGASLAAPAVQAVFMAALNGTFAEISTAGTWLDRESATDRPNC